MYFHFVAWYIDIPPTMRMGSVIKKVTNEKKEKINHETAENNTHIIKRMKSAKITKMTETSQPKACLM